MLQRAVSGRTVSCVSYFLLFLSYSEKDDEMRDRYCKGKSKIYSSSSAKNAGVQRLLTMCVFFTFKKQFVALMVSEI